MRQQVITTKEIQERPNTKPQHPNRHTTTVAVVAHSTKYYGKQPGAVEFQDCRWQDRCSRPGRPSAPLTGARPWPDRGKSVAVARARRRRRHQRALPPRRPLPGTHLVGEPVRGRAQLDLGVEARLVRPCDQGHQLRTQLFRTQLGRADPGPLAPNPNPGRRNRPGPPAVAVAPPATAPAARTARRQARTARRRRRRQPPWPTAPPA